MSDIDTPYTSQLITRVRALDAELVALQSKQTAGQASTVGGRTVTSNAYDIQVSSFSTMKKVLLTYSPAYETPGVTSLANMYMVCTDSGGGTVTPYVRQLPPPDGKARWIIYLETFSAVTWCRLKFTIADYGSGSIVAVQI